MCSNEDINLGKTFKSLPKWFAPASLLEYDDVLGERRGASDLRWAAREWKSTGSFRGSRAVSHQEAVKRVLNSTRVQEAIAKTSESQEVSSYQLKKEVVDILKTMGHQLDISAIRKFAFTLPKLMKTIYDKVLVHRPGMERLRRALQEHPVVLLPTHRSYADFLLVSYLAYHYDLPFPVIAAGMDFIHMAYIGALLRQSGAFYIKRSFVDDELYWAVFQEYVQVLICHEEAPLEFFLEGTRSRTAKSLRPKLGLLGCVCQSAWRGLAKDVLLVPINISYSRTLEEELYAYELLGVPKPKESTSGLFKATKILNERYGNMYFHVGVPVLASSFMDPEPSLGTFHQTAPSTVAPLSQVEMSRVESLAMYLVKEQQRMAVISSFSIAAHFLLQAAAGQESGTCPLMPFGLLVSKVKEVVAYFQGQGRSGPILELSLRDVSSKEDPVCADLLRSFALHSNILYIDADEHVCLVPYSVCPSSESSAITGTAVEHMLLQHYANQSLHLFVLPALLFKAITSETEQQGISPVTEAKVFNRFQKLCLLFSHEFIFTKFTIKTDFEENLARLVSSGVVKRDRGNIILSQPLSSAHTSLLCSCLDPFILTYSTAIAIAASSEWASESGLAAQIQLAVDGKLQRAPFVYSALSLDTARNAIKGVARCGGLRCVRTDKNRVRIVGLRETLVQLQLLLTGKCDDVLMPLTLKCKL